MILGRLGSPRERVRRFVDATIERFRRRGGSAIAWMARLTAAAVASFVVANLVFPRGVPLLAPLTALLVVQLTPVSILASGLERVVSVVAGVAVAVGFSSLVGLTWWSLGIAIAVSLMIGQALRLGSNQIEVPISAMLVLGVGAATAESAAWQRIAETLVGAGVGVLSNLVFPPKVTSGDAASAIGQLGDDLARLLDSAALDVAENAPSPGALSDRAKEWLSQARRLTHDVPSIGSALLQAEESRRLNLRALGQVDSGPGLRHGLEALEHSSVAVRSMSRSFVDAAEAYEADGAEIPIDVRASVVLLLNDLATALRSFAALVRAESRPVEATRELAEHQAALDGLRQAREQLTELLLIDPHEDAALAGLGFSLRATVERLLQELDLGERGRRRAPQPPRPRRLIANPSRQRHQPPKMLRRRTRHGHRPR